MTDKSETVNYFLDKGFLVSPTFFKNLDSDFDNSNFFNALNKKTLSKPLILNEDLLDYIKLNKLLDFNWVDFDRARVMYEKNIGSFLYSKFRDLISVNFLSENKNSQGTVAIQEVIQEKKQIIQESKEQDGKVNILFSYEEKNKKREVQDFVKHFKARYESIKKILYSRQELKESVSIARLARKSEGESTCIIGVVLEKEITKNNNYIFTLEDPTGSFKVLITKSREELYNVARDLVHDEVIGVTGVIGNNILFCNNIYLPEIPINNELKKSPDEVYAVFISDVHFGIKNFLAGDFMKFIMWLKGEYGTEQQKDVASKVKYLFVTGDVVEGVGIYPGQEEDLAIKDIYAQYDEATRYFKMIPERIKIIICAGNHDAIRIAELQPIFDKDLSKGFFTIPNMIQVSNPAMVNIHSSDGFPGFNVLMYHGFSFFYYGDQVPSIREKGGIARCDLIMKYLLQKRHLAPSHGSNLYVPDEQEDPLVIEKVPDIFVSGHVHQITVGSYRNVSLINSSCWVVQSEDNAKRGMVPHPSKIPIINLKTREVRIMNFLDDETKVLFNERQGLI